MAARKWSYRNCRREAGTPRVTSCSRRTVSACSSRWALLPTMPNRFRRRTWRRPRSGRPRMHSASLGLVFYTATSGKYAFPSEYVGDGFAMLHGSWNRGFRTGHKVVRVRMKDGVPTGEYEDFVTGFIVDDGDAWGRPVSGVVLK